MASETVRITGQYDQLQSVRELVQRAAEQAGLSSKDCYACQLAVSEAVENIIRHGYGREVQNEIEVTVASKPGELSIELSDDAAPFNPSNQRRIKEWSEDDPPVGGLGIEIIHRTMDDVDYKREKGRNRLSLLKRKNNTLG